MPLWSVGFDSEIQAWRVTGGMRVPFCLLGGMRLLQSGAGRGFCVGWGGAAEFDAFFDIGADGVLDVFGGDAEGVFHGEWA